MSELDGFVVYRPDEKPIYISSHDKYISLSAGAFKALGEPECVNVFIDEIKHRIMIKAAEKDFENVMSIIEHSSGRNRVICNKKLAAVAVRFFGRGVHTMGHAAGDNCVIFQQI